MGPHNGALKIKLTAPPVDGKANECLIEFLSDTLNVPKRAVHILKGDTGRNKVVEVDGLDEVAARILLNL
ncbi:hypothetical protein D3C87_1995710 [compost metagenome]